jgi:RES domain-containing protein
VKLAACGALGTKPENRVWYRALQPQHWPTALATAHTTRIPSRYNSASHAQSTFPLLYLAEDHRVALFEVDALLGSALPGGHYVPNPSQAWVILNVQVTLHAVADLTATAEQARLLTTAQELTGDWRGYLARQAPMSVSQPTGPAPTQLLGEALHRVRGLEGFRTVSARVPTHMNLVVFPDKLRRGSSITFTNPATGQTLTIP